MSHNVIISGNVVYPDTVGGSMYTIDGLQSDTLYNITVTSTHNGSIRILNKDVRTIISSCKFWKLAIYMHLVNQQKYTICSWLATYLAVRIYMSDIKYLLIATNN